MCEWKIKKCRRLYMEKIDYDVVLGIDPGSNGGISVCYHDGNVKTIKMPKELSDIRQLLSYVKDVSVNPIVFVEKVQLRSDDISDNPGKAFRIQQLLMSFQRLKDYIEIENIPYVQVHPVTWQSYLKLRKKGEEKKDRKDRYKMAAGHYYPTVKPTLWNADAILIMHFGRLKIQNDPNWVFQNMTADSCQNSMF